MSQSGSSSDKGDKNNPTNVYKSRTTYIQNVSDTPQFLPNNYHGIVVNGGGVNADGVSQWAAAGKLPDLHHQQQLQQGVEQDNYTQDEANFVQSFAVQQPLISYPYLGGYQQPFGNPLYPQFGYSFGSPYGGLQQQYVGLDGQLQGQGYFAVPGGYPATTTGGELNGDGMQGGVANGDSLAGVNQIQLFPQFYQLGDAFSKLSLQDAQAQQLLQQQLYHHHLLQLQQQQQQLEQQLLQTSQQLALHASQLAQNKQEKPLSETDPTTQVDAKVDAQQDKSQTKELGPQQTTSQAQPNQQSEHQSTQQTTQQDMQKTTQQDTQRTTQQEIQQTAQQNIQATQQPTPEVALVPTQQKTKQEGPRSWAAIASKQTSSSPTPSSTAPTAADVNNSTPSTPHPLIAPSNVSPAQGAGALTVSKPRNVPGSSAKPMAQKINPTHFDYNVPYARFFVIKSYSEDDIHKAIKYNIWASTDSGNRRLDAAYRESSTRGPIYLFFSVNASGQFCGMARMTSALDYNKKCELWAQDKWNGQFSLQWIFVKDIPNGHLRHIKLVNNENKPVTNSRDTQEIFLEPGREVLRIFSTFTPKTSIMDDFSFYDKRQEELMKEKKGQLDDLDGYEILPVVTCRTQPTHSTNSTTLPLPLPLPNGKVATNGTTAKSAAQPHRKK